MNTLPIVPDSACPALNAGVAAFILASKADTTRKAYATDWQHFEYWCNAGREVSLPAFPETVARYISALAESRKPSTIQRRLASIAVAHQAAGYPSPAGAPIVRATMQGIRRTLGMAQRRAAPLMVEHVRRAVALMGDSLQDTRDKAILLIGLAGAFRRSELVALDVADLDFREQGVVVTLRKSKTNQEGGSESKDIGFGTRAATCPVRALKHWLNIGGISEGPVFRPIAARREGNQNRLGDRAIARIVKGAAQRIGLRQETFSGHSLRAGFVTQGYREGIAEADIMQQTGHRSREVLGKYRREGERFRTNLSAKVGL